MKKFLLVLASAFAVALGMAGCNSDNGTNITPSILPYKAGDVFTYDYFIRDTTTDQNIPATKMVRKWTVLQTGISYQGKTGVTMFKQESFDSTGATLVTTDTVYIALVGNEEVWQYDLVGTAMMRPLVKYLVPTVPDSTLQQIPKAWVQISNIKAVVATSWMSAPVSQFNVSALGQTLVVTDSMVANHVGTQSVTAGGTAYASSVHTDHLLRVSAKTTTGIGFLTDSVYIRCDVDSKDGLLRMLSNSKQVKPLTGARQVPGWEMILTAIVRAK